MRLETITVLRAPNRSQNIPAPGVAGMRTSAAMDKASPTLPRVSSVVAVK